MNLLIVAATEFEIEPFLKEQTNAEILITGVGIPATIFHLTKKLSEKNADILVLNSLNDPGAGFGLDTNKITIFDKKKSEFQFSVKTKKEVAVDIVNAIIQYENE